MSETVTPPATTTLTPHLTCRNAAEALDFYQKAFGAEKNTVQKTPDGKVLHAALSIRGASFFVTDEYPEHGALGPEAIGDTPVTLHLYVPDCDAVFQRAVDAGCTVAMPLEDAFWGDRYGQLKDPYGHSWAVATSLRQPSPEEIQQALSRPASPSQ